MAIKTKLSFISKEHLRSNIYCFFFQPSSPIVFQAGQYLQLNIPHNSDEKGTTRFFTISSAPHEEQIMITTKQSEKSTFKNALFALQPGDTVEAFGPIGTFVLAD